MAADRLVVRVRPGAGADDIARRIKKVAPSLTCAACGGRDFALLEEPAHRRRSVFERRTPQAIPADQTYIPHYVASLVCTTCGLLHQFSDGVILECASPDEWGVDIGEEA